MGARPSRHARHDHVPLLTEMQMHRLPDDERQQYQHQQYHDEPTISTSSDPHHEDLPRLPPPPQTQQHHHQDLPHHYFFSSPLASTPLGGPTATTATPTPLDAHHANFTFYRSSIPPPRHSRSRSRKLLKLRRVLLCEGWVRGRRGGPMRMEKVQQQKYGRGYRDDEDGFSVAESWDDSASLKSEMSVSELHLPAALGRRAACELKERGRGEMTE
ncbi:hypothetical protein B0J12DRAFT_16121 [Macrophomina phaseolina]|uniref:Uncharacterized protein n=1 Tax=Macrophomina phaseolina TaxID=35725 RepID=A0ABQ8GUF8_9PEZI|nr:hypothetical protein B0J12DRAFT_16121 [Macrophomina phaseolina]